MDDVPFYKTSGFWSKVVMLGLAVIALLVVQGVIEADAAPGWMALLTAAVSVAAAIFGVSYVDNANARVQIERYQAETAQAELAAQLEAQAVAGFEGEAVALSSGAVIPVKLRIEVVHE